MFLRRPINLIQEYYLKMRSIWRLSFVVFQCHPCIVNRHHDTENRNIYLFQTDYNID